MKLKGSQGNLIQKMKPSDKNSVHLGWFHFQEYHLYFKNNL
jgi:hypothetical protein